MSNIIQMPLPKEEPVPFFNVTEGEVSQDSPVKYLPNGIPGFPCELLEVDVSRLNREAQVRAEILKSQRLPDFKGAILYGKEVCMLAQDGRVYLTSMNNIRRMSETIDLTYEPSRATVIPHLNLEVLNELFEMAKNRKP